jgi:hypothetical protein
MWVRRQVKCDLAKFSYLLCIELEALLLISIVTTLVWVLGTPYATQPYLCLLCMNSCMFLVYFLDKYKNCVIV